MVMPTLTRGLCGLEINDFAPFRAGRADILHALWLIVEMILSSASSMRDIAWLQQFLRIAPHRAK
jgi:hypothetical protein